MHYHWLAVQFQIAVNIVAREKKRKRGKSEKFVVVTVADLSPIVETTVMVSKQVWDRLPVVLR